MRSIGIVCIALGVVVFIFSAFPMLLAGGTTHVLVGLGCMAFIGVPFILTGIVLTRRAAAQAGPEGEAKASERFLHRASQVLEALGGAPVAKPDPNGGRMERLRVFDLNTLTPAGWLLVLGAGGCLFGGSFLLLKLFQRNQETDMGPIGPVVTVFGSFLLAVAFFFGGRLLLGRFGVSIIRRVDPPSDRDPGK